MSDRWTCHNENNQDYCKREHKSEEAACQCAFRLERIKAGDKPEDWQTIQVEKGFYANGGDNRN